MNLTSLIMIALCLGCSPAPSSENHHISQLAVAPADHDLHKKAPLIKIANGNKENEQLAKSYCKQKYAKRYSGIDLRADGNFRCLYRRTPEEIRTQAVLECKEKHGDMYKDVELRGRRYRCIFKKTKEQLIQEARRICKKRYGNRLVSVSFPLAENGTYSRFVCEH